MLCKYYSWFSFEEHAIFFVKMCSMGTRLPSDTYSLLSLNTKAATASTRLNSFLKVHGVFLMGKLLFKPTW